MIVTDWRGLVVLSVRNPAEGARVLMGLNLPGRALWTALALVAVLNTILFTLSNILFPGPTPLPEVLTAPTVYLAVVFGGLALTVYSIFWVGRMLGGQGALADILVLIVWLQALRVAVQAVALVLMLVVPLLSGLLVLAAGLIGVWMMVHFVNEAHRLNSLGRAVGVLVASLLAIVVGLSVLLSLVAGPIVGSTPHV